MTTDKQTFVIAGASLAGATAAQTLRDEGFNGRVVLVGAEPERPYERPLLSKEHLRGEADRGTVFVHDPSFYADNEIELRVGESVIDVDADHRRLTLDTGERLTFDRLLLATGAEPRRHVWDVNETIQALIRSGEPIDERRLADPDVPLMDLIAVDDRVAS